MLIVLAIEQDREPQPLYWQQCGNFTTADLPRLIPKEKCRLKGKITVNRVAGAFHIAPGKNSKYERGHAHVLSPVIPRYDLSHTIERLRFAQKIPTAHQALEGSWYKVKRKVPSASHYALMVTPVVYLRNGVIQGHGFEYKAMTKHLEMARGLVAVPGLHFSYRFTPYTVSINVRPVSLFSFVASTASLLTGAFTIAMWADSYWHSREKRAGPEVL
jgi:hypothetical protein